jgi:hypothetical protein
MKVYHGSYTEISKVDFMYCEVGKDFGQNCIKKHGRKSTNC